MTDLFISAAAALLIVLAVLKPQPPVALPIQGDVLVLCGPQNEEASYRLFASPDTADVFVDISSPDALHSALQTLGRDNAMLVNLSMVHEPGRPLTGTCLRNFTIDYVRAVNKAASELTGEEARRRPAVLSVQVGRNYDLVEPM